MAEDALSHIDPSIVHLLSEPKAVRVRYVHTDRFIEHKLVAEILNHLEYLAAQPRQVRAWGLGVVGLAGSGKSMLANALVRRLKARYQRRVGHTAPEMPAVAISMTGAREAKTINNRILGALHAPIGSRLSQADREELIVHLLREADTRILIIDEIQDVLSSTPRQQSVALDHIRFLMNSLGIPLAVFGIPGAIEAMKLDPHLAARFDWRTLPSWKVDKDTRSLLLALERRLPLRLPSDLASVTHTKTIVEHSQGILGRMVKLVNRAAVFAIQDDKDRITETLLERAKTEVPASSAFFEEGDNELRD